VQARPTRAAATDVSITFLSPQGLLVALLAAVPLGAAVLVGRRAEVVRRTLGLAADRSLVRRQVAAAVVVVGVLVGLACAQPVVTREETFRVRSDAEAYIVLDVSRSMLAAEEDGGPTRLLRARRAAARVRGDLADVPVGLASLSDRVLPHVLPTVDGEAFVEALSRSLGVGRPAPQRVAVLATAFDVLGGMATLNFYRDGVGRRLAIVLTDGETLPVDEEGLEGTLAGAAPVEFLFVRFWGPEERIFGPGGLVEEAYRPDPTAGRRFERFVSAFGAELYDADELGDVAQRAREIVGEGPTRQEERVVQEVPLAPYAALGAVLPLLLVLARRNRV
jgi:hypothetical protein